MTETKQTVPAGLSRRFIAYLIDWYIGALATAFPVSAVSMKLFGTVQNQNLLSFTPPYGLIAGGLGVLCAVLYYVFVPAFVWRGQTVAKRWLKIKIVSADGSEAGVGKIFSRQFLGMIIIEGSLVTASTVWHQMVTILTGADAVKVLMYAGMAVSLVSAVMVLFKNHRALHDYIGGTIVVMNK